MDFEQMRVVWDEQEKRRVYALDVDALHASVRRRARKIALGVETMEVGLVVLSIASGLYLLSEPLLRGTDRYKYASAAVPLLVALYVVLGRLRRRARERRFAPTLLGDVELALAQVDYHIHRVRTFPLWFCAPFAVPVLLGFAFGHAHKPAWMWLLVCAAFPFSAWFVRLELACLHLPRKRELEALRAKLIAER